MSYTMTYAQGGLPAAADYIRSKGRNEDSLLVHMTPGEVNALQQMAVQHGGSLTINPETGLPEAGFLGDILSVAVPAAAMFIPGVGAGIASLGSAVTGGAATGALATGLGMGLISGGITALTTGDIGKGLTTGLTSGLMAGVGQSLFGGKVDPTGVNTGTAAEAINPAGARVAAQANTGVNTGLNIQGTYSPALASPQTAAAALPVPMTKMAAAPAPGLFDKASNWFNGLSTPQQIGVGAAGLGTVAALGGAFDKKGVNVPVDKGNIRPYTYAANQVTPYPGATEQGQPVPMYNAMGNANLDKEERQYYNPSYTAQPIYSAAAEGGVMKSYAQGGIAGLAQGGMGNNMGYPQGRLDTTQYATPSQMPTSAQVVNADYEQATDPYLGSPLKMAEGGSTNQYTYDPKNQKYAEVPPPAAPVEDYSNARLFGQPGIMQSMVNQLNSQSPGVGNQWAKGMTSFAPGLAGVPQHLLNQQPNGGMGNIFSSFFNNMAQQATEAQQSQPQYRYDPVNQRYTQLAEGGDVSSEKDITSGYQGYGQQQTGRNPLELLSALAAQQKQQPQQNTTVVRQAQGGLSTLGGYSDGGRMLKGPGDGMSDDIPGIIGGKQPARLADGEFVVPADVVSHLGNGSTDAGAKRLYSMMDQVRKARTGNKKQGKQIKADKYLPA